MSRKILTALLMGAALAGFSFQTAVVVAHSLEHTLRDTPLKTRQLPTLDEDHCDLCLVYHAQAHGVASGFVVVSELRNYIPVAFLADLALEPRFSFNAHPARAPPFVTHSAI